MLHAISWALVAVYLAMPVGYCAWAFRRGAGQGRRVFSAIVTLAVGFMIGIGLCAAVAAMTGVNPLIGVAWTEALLAGYFVSGVILTLRLADALLRAALTRAVRQRGLPLIMLAAVFRVAVLAVVVIPWVMGVGMVYRVKVVGQTWPPGWRGQQVTFAATDGVQLTGYYFTAGGGPPSDRTVIIAHGLGATGLMQVTMARDLRRDGWNVLAFDFRAHGRSGGHLTSFGIHEAQDVLAAVNYLKSQKPDNAAEIVAAGASMGGAAVLSAAASLPAIQAAAVIGSFSDMPRLAADVSQSYFRWPISAAVNHIALPIASMHAGVDLASFRPVRSVEQIWPRPVMVVHGTRDEIIPFGHGMRLYDAAGPGRQRLWLEGSHNSVIDDGQTARGLAEFFRRAESVPEI